MKTLTTRVPAVIVMIVFLMCILLPNIRAQVQFAGVNLAGAEFGSGTLPGKYNQHYTYPTKAEVDYFTEKGMNTFRLPFRWERLQYEVFAELNSAELSRIKNFVVYASSKGAYTVLDPHNYARYFGKVIGSAEVPVEAFADFWKKLATEFKEDSSVIFGLMNEPHDMATESWLEAANAAIASIRSTNAQNLILVPGNGYSGAHSWNSDWYGTSNAVVMQNISDPGNNYAFEVHQYFDNNSSGSSETCVSASVGADRLKSFTSWLRNNNQRGFLGEFGISSNETCMQALDNMLEYLHSNTDVWLGWTYWAAGPWWGDYMFSVEPQNNRDKPQMNILEQYLGDPLSSAGMNSKDSKKKILAGNYPNPFSSSTKIQLFLPEVSHVRLGIYDVSGMKVTELVDDKLAAGYHEIGWNGINTQNKKMPSGIYFCRLRTGTSQQIIKLMVIPERKY